MSVLFAILLFSFLIFIHELGHFVAAKLSGVQVNEFSMFMGPAIFKKQAGETLYTIRCIPLGGRVFNIDGSIFVPIRPLARALGAQLRVFGHGENMVIDLRRENGASIISGSEYYNAEDLYWLSRVIFAESGNQPIEGMIGVGNVVLNRVRDDSGLFPDSVQGVIFQSGQFSALLKRMEAYL